MSYSRFNTDDIVLSSDIISVPIWSNGKDKITGDELTTSNIQTIGASGLFYLDVYSKTEENTPDKVQFTVAYADVDGKGTAPYNSRVEKNTPSRTLYGQYRSLVLGDEESTFKFGKNGTEDAANFWIISVERARYREKLKPGSLDLRLQLTQDGAPILLVDGGTVGDSVVYKDSGRVYNIYKNSNAEGLDVSRETIYGYFLPDIGTILLDCKTILGDEENKLLRTTLGADENNLRNSEKFLAYLDSISLGEQETVTSNYIFVRAKNSEFNYSINPSNITTTGELTHSIMINQPETYITTVGLYNDSNELLAVAKLSKPLSKNFNKEALIRIKLDY